MKYTFEKLSPPPALPKQLTANDMKIGDLAEIITGGVYRGGILLRHYSGWVMLNKPDATWNKNTFGCQLPIRFLTAGETVVLKVTE